METPIYVLETNEIGTTGLLDYVTVSFHMDEHDKKKHRYTQNTIYEKAERIIDKISFCFSDGISLTYKLAKMTPTQLPNPNSETNLFKVILRINFHYEMNPNFYKIKQQGLLPCTPEYDKQTFIYFLHHGFEPILNNITQIIFQ